MWCSHCQHTAAGFGADDLRPFDALSAAMNISAALAVRSLVNTITGSSVCVICSVINGDLERVEIVKPAPSRPVNWPRPNPTRRKAEATSVIASVSPPPIAAQIKNQAMHACQVLPNYASEVSRNLFCETVDLNDREASSFPMNSQTEVALLPMPLKLRGSFASVFLFQRISTEVPGRPSNRVAKVR